MRYLITFVLLFGSIGLYAQHSSAYNTGDLYVSPHTLMTFEGDFINKESGDYKNDGEVLLKGDFSNQGLAGFDQEGGITRFEGKSVQIIAGDLPVDYYNVYLDNESETYAFDLKGGMYIHGEVNFFQGIVDNKNNGGILFFEPGADHFNTSDQSYVEGIVDKKGAESFTYPVGKSGYYRPAKTVLESGKPQQFSGEFIFDNSNEYYQHNLKEGVLKAIDNKEYWIINREEQNEEGAFVSLSYRDVTTPAKMISAARSKKKKLVVVRWDEENNMWVNEGGTTDTDEKMVTSEAVSGDGVFTLGVVHKEDLEPCDIVVYNALTPNGDGINDYLRIEDEGGCNPDLRVRVYNRWGVQVFATEHYGTNGEVFRGFSNGRATIEKGKQLPTGTYFYIIEYEFERGEKKKTHKKAGYLYISGNEGN